MSCAVAHRSLRVRSQLRLEPPLRAACRGSPNGSASSRAAAVAARRCGGATRTVVSRGTLSPGRAAGVAAAARGAGAGPAASPAGRRRAAPSRPAARRPAVSTGGRTPGTAGAGAGAPGRVVRRGRRRGAAVGVGSRDAPRAGAAPSRRRRSRARGRRARGGAARRSGAERETHQCAGRGYHAAERAGQPGRRGGTARGGRPSGSGEATRLTLASSGEPRWNIPGSPGATTPVAGVQPRVAELGRYRTAPARGLAATAVHPENRAVTSTHVVKITSRYVLREHVGPLMFALTRAHVAAPAATTSRASSAISSARGFPGRPIAQFFVLSLPFTIAMTLPMAVLVSTLYAFSRLASENEITAFKASGVSMARAARARALRRAAARRRRWCCSTTRCSPRANHTAQHPAAGHRAHEADVRAQRAGAERGHARRFLRPREHAVTTRRGTMRDVTIYDLSQQSPRTIHADSGALALAPNGQDLQLTLYDGSIEELGDGRPDQLQRTFFTTQLVRVRDIVRKLRADEAGANDFKSDREMSICELQQAYLRVAAPSTSARSSSYDIAIAGLAEAAEAASATPKRTRLPRHRPAVLHRRCTGVQAGVKAAKASPHRRSPSRPAAQPPATPAADARSRPAQPRRTARGASRPCSARGAARSVRRDSRRRSRRSRRPSRRRRRRSAAPCRRPASRRRRRRPAARRAGAAADPGADARHRRPCSRRRPRRPRRLGRADRRCPTGPTFGSAALDAGAAPGQRDARRA